MQLSTPTHSLASSGALESPGKKKHRKRDMIGDTLKTAKKDKHSKHSSDEKREHVNSNNNSLNNSLNNIANSPPAEVTNSSSVQKKSSGEYKNEDSLAQISITKEKVASNEKLKKEKDKKKNKDKIKKDKKDKEKEEKEKNGHKPLSRKLTEKGLSGNSFFILAHLYRDYFVILFYSYLIYFIR